ncbi:MAG: filamentous hemagglutinin N-terminal domain-containing protein [Candidatus Omnitrophica bacterium]|nr:filamentous hemagglutinin N-terminal domain-containing protein [Candidatus Omnitrophota bacterium]
MRHLKRALFFSLILSIGLEPMAHALPTGMRVESGEVTVESSDERSLVIHAADQAIINFDSFSIAENESVRFIQPFESASVLGRVTGGSLSDIFGALSASGRLFLVNPAGIHFHSSAQIDVHSLVASTLDIQSAMFRAGEFSFEKAAGSGLGRILNEAEISAAEGGFLAFLAEQVENRGLLSARLGTVALGAGQKQTLSFDEQGLIHLIIDEGVARSLENGSALLENSGVIAADGGRVILQAFDPLSLLRKAVNLQGVVEADTVTILTDGSIEIGTSVKGRSTVELTGRGASTIYGDNTFYNLICRAPSKTLNFEAGKTQTVLGEFHIEGARGELVNIHSTDPGNAQWRLDARGETSLRMVHLGDAWNISDTVIKAIPSNSFGNNTGFDTDPVWSATGGGAKKWSTASNWDTGVVPGVSDTVTFNGTSLKDSQVDNNFGGTIAELNINSGYTGTITLQRSLSVTGNMSVGAGTFDAQNENLTVGGLTVSGGTLDGDRADLDVNGNVTISGGTFTAPSGSFAVSGNWSKTGGTFDAAGETVTFDGADQSISGDTTFHHLTKNVTTARTLTFEAGSAQTVTGALNLQGAVNALLSLRSSVDGTRWAINPQGARTIQYLDVKDSENSNAVSITAFGFNITNSGNNTGWNFTAAAATTTAAFSKKTSVAAIREEMKKVRYERIPVVVPVGNAGVLAYVLGRQKPNLAAK